MDHVYWNESRWAGTKTPQTPTSKKAVPSPVKSTPKTSKKPSVEELKKDKKGRNHEKDKKEDKKDKKEDKKDNKEDKKDNKDNKDKKNKRNENDEKDEKGKKKTKTDAKKETAVAKTRPSRRTKEAASFYLTLIGQEEELDSSDMEDQTTPAAEAEAPSQRKRSASVSGVGVRTRRNTATDSPVSKKRAILREAAKRFTQNSVRLEVKSVAITTNPENLGPTVKLDSISVQWKNLMRRLRSDGTEQKWVETWKKE